MSKASLRLWPESCHTFMSRLICILSYPEDQIPNADKSNVIWVIPYQFAKLLHMTPSELDGIRCVGSSGGHVSQRNFILILVWLPRNGLSNILLFCYFCCTCDHSKRYNLGLFHFLKNELHHCTV